jgi:hypothetical protein
MTRGARAAAAAPAMPTPALTLRLGISPAIALGHVLAWSALAAGFTLLVVHYSLSRGKLIVPAHYDDVTYLRDGLDKLDGFYRGGLPGLAGRVSLRPPHSPFSTALAFAGFALFGIHDWAPYAADAIVILALLALTDFVTRGMRAWQKIIAALFVLTIPIAAQAVYEFRADVWVGVLTAAVIVLLLDRPLVRASPAYLTWTGIIGGVALLSKTSIFPVTLGLCGSALLAASVRDRILLGREATVAALGRAWGRILLPALVIPLPYYLFNRNEIYHYITVNALGANSGIWALHAGLATHLLYYATGEGAQVMLGRHLAIMVVVLLAGAIVLLPQRGKPVAVTAACYAFVLAVAYAGPTLNPIKDQFLAVTFDFVLIAATLKVLAGLLRADAAPPAVRTIAGVALVLLLIAGAWCAKWPMYWGEPNRPDVVMRNRYMNDLYQAIRAHDTDERGMILVGVTGVFANADAFGYMADKDGLTGLNFQSDFANKDIAGFKLGLDQSRFVILGDPGNPEDDPNTPYTAILDRTLALVRGRADFKMVATCPAAAGKNYYLFEHQERQPR